MFCMGDDDGQYWDKDGVKEYIAAVSQSRVKCTAQARPLTGSRQ